MGMTSVNDTSARAARSSRLFAFVMVFMVFLGQRNTVAVDLTPIREHTHPAISRTVGLAERAVRTVVVIQVRFATVERWRGDIRALRNDQSEYSSESDKCEGAHTERGPWRVLRWDLRCNVEMGGRCLKAALTRHAREPHQSP